MSSPFLSLLSIIIASLAASWLGHYPIRLVMNHFWREYYRLPGSVELFGPSDLNDKSRYFSKWVGIVERFVYVASWLLGKPEAIAIILALKAAPSIKEWSEGKALGRALFNIWLIGNLISIIGSIFIAELVHYLFVTYLP